MTRLLFVLAALLFASPASAATMTASKILPATNNGGAEAPWSVEFKMVDTFLPEVAVLASLTFDSTTRDEMVVVTESNVGDFGETWENVQLWADGLNNLGLAGTSSRSVMWSFSGKDAPGLGQGAYSDLLESVIGMRPSSHIRLADFVITSVTLDLIPGSNSNSAAMQWTIEGDGRVAPEPSCFLLLMVALVLAPMRAGQLRGSKPSNQR